jgi:peptidoglycan/LPS O-acetylase OafA/YrhL
MVLIEHAQQLIPPIATPAVPGAGFLRWLLFEHTPLRILEVGRPAVLFFFVLSGYVLTRALLASGSPGLLAFAAQRSIRLILPVGASLLLSAALYHLVFDPRVVAELGDRALHTWLEPPTTGQLVRSALLVATAGELGLNIPLWSLVQEWRLTVLLPLVLLFRGRALQLLLLACALMLAGQILGAREDAAQLGHDLRASVASTLYFTLAVGAGVATALLGPALVPAQGQRTLLLALGAILFSMKSDLAIYAGSAILIVVAQEPGAFQQVLRRPVMVWLGRISFSLYLVHVPVLVAVAHALHGLVPPFTIAVLGGALALPAAALMRVAVEEPSRRLARRVERMLSSSARSNAEAPEIPR